MRRKATPKKVSPRGAKGNANTSNKAREKTPLKVIKPTGKPNKTPTGKGLGKAGAKRLGRLLKRAIVVPEEQQESGGREKLSLPKTPVRLLKHQIQTEAENASTAKPAPPDVPQLILSVVSHCKHRGGISMAELRQALAAGGYNITKNSRRVDVVTQRLVDNETLVRTRRNVSFRLNNKKNQTPADSRQVQTRSVKSPKQGGDPNQRQNASKSSKGTEKSQRQTRTPKPKGKTRAIAVKPHKLTGKTRKPAARSHKPRARTRKPAAKSHKLTGKTRQPRRRTLRTKRKPPGPTGRKGRSTAKQVARVRKTPRKAQRARRPGPKQNHHLYKSSRRRPQPRRRPRVRTQQRQVARRRAYYY